MVVEDGTYTGEIAFYAYGPDKADGDPRARRPSAGYDLAASLRLQRLRHRRCRCSRRSATRYAVNPDRALRREAIARGWPVLDFVHPAPLRRRLNGLTDAAGSRAPGDRDGGGGPRSDGGRRVGRGPDAPAGRVTSGPVGTIGTGQDDRGKFESRWVYYP